MGVGKVVLSRSKGRPQRRPSPSNPGSSRQATNLLAVKTRGMVRPGGSTVCYSTTSNRS